MKSICFITTGDIKRNAVAKRALGMAVPLSNSGWKVHIIMENSEENHHRETLLNDKRVSFYYYPCSSVFKEIKAKKQILITIKPTYIYLCAFVMRNIIPIHFKCKKFVEHSELLSAVNHRSTIRKICDIILEYYSIIYADGILNASNYLQNVYTRRLKHLHFVKNKPMLYFPYAYNPNQMQIKRNDFLPEFDLYKNKTVFIYLGTISKNYGIFTIIEATKKLKETYSDFCVIVLGYGKDYDRAVKLVNQYDLSKNVYMHGFIEEEYIADFFSLASAFISPMNDTIQDWARCPSKLYMYLPYKKPIITCRIGEPLATLKDKGLYYLPNNINSLKEQMEKIINKKATRSNINPLLHTWETRTATFNKWIDRYFQ